MVPELLTLRTIFISLLSLAVKYRAKTAVDPQLFNGAATTHTMNLLRLNILLFSYFPQVFYTISLGSVDIAGSTVDSAS
jgi:hypothetical protein